MRSLLIQIQGSGASSPTLHEGIKVDVMRVYINNNRDGYTPDQCYKTLTVGELMEILEDYPADAEVFVKNDGGYTYGSIDLIEEGE